MYKASVAFVVVEQEHFFIFFFCRFLLRRNRQSRDGLDFVFTARLSTAEVHRTDPSDGFIGWKNTDTQ